MASLVTVTVADQPLTNLAVVVKPLVSIKGTALIESAGDGNNKDETEPTPLTIEFRPFELDDSGGWEEAEVTDGTFTMDDLHPGRYRVEVQSGAYVKTARLGDEDVLENPLEISEGGAPGALALVLSSKCAEVSGEVRDIKGTPKPGAWALLLPEEKYRDQPGRYGFGPADQHGAFHIKNVRPGKYKLIALEDVEYGEWMDPEFTKPNEKDAIPLTLEEGQKESRQLTIRAYKPAEN